MFPPDTFSFNQFNVLPKTEFWCISDSTLSRTTKFVFIWQLHKALSWIKSDNPVVAGNGGDKSDYSKRHINRVICHMKVISVLEKLRFLYLAIWSYLNRNNSFGGKNQAEANFFPNLEISLYLQITFGFLTPAFELLNLIISISLIATFLLN